MYNINNFEIFIYNKLTFLFDFIDLIQDNDVQEISHICHGEKTDIFTCLESLQSHTKKFTTLYNKVLSKLKGNYQLLPSVIYDCLYNPIDNFFELLTLLNIHFDRCIKNQIIHFNCLDVPFYFRDTNNHTHLDEELARSSIKTINAILAIERKKFYL